MLVKTNKIHEFSCITQDGQHLLVVIDYKFNGNSHKI